MTPSLPFPPPSPSICRTQTKNFTNFLDSFGRITSWDLRGETTVKYSSRLIKSELYNASFPTNEVETISRHITQQRTEPKTTPGAFDLATMDNTDVNVFVYPNSSTILALTDFHAANIIDLEGLHTLGTAPVDDSALPFGATFSGVSGCGVVSDGLGL